MYTPSSFKEERRDSLHALIRAHPLGLQVVPTWNYSIVQAAGAASVIEDPAWIRQQIEDLTRQHEQSRPAPWSVDDAPADYIATQMKALIGIEIPIARLEGKFKMSQNKPETERAGVVAGTGNPDDPHDNPALCTMVKNTMK